MVHKPDTAVMWVVRQVVGEREGLGSHDEGLGSHEHCFLQQEQLQQHL